MNVSFVHGIYNTITFVCTIIFKKRINFHSITNIHTGALKVRDGIYNTIAFVRPTVSLILRNEKAVAVFEERKKSPTKW